MILDKIGVIGNRDTAAFGTKKHITAPLARQGGYFFVLNIKTAAINIENARYVKIKQRNKFLASYAFIAFALWRKFVCVNSGQKESVIPIRRRHRHFCG